MVDKESAVEVIDLVLQHACKVAPHPFVMCLKSFVYVLHPDAGVACYAFVNARQRETTLFQGFLL